MLLQGRKFLLVDDFESIRKTIKKELILSGAERVDEAGNGEEALRMLHENRYDAVLSDWNMPKKTGFELLKEIRADKQLHTIPVMLITAETNRDMVSDAIKHNVNDFLVKPFTLQLLMERVQLLINGHTTTPQEIHAILDTPITHEIVGLAEEQSNFKNSTVLVVDDNSDNLDVIVGSLKGDCKIKAANSAAVARKILEKLPIDLILLDVMMPEEDGFTFCEWLKQQASYKDIPILFLTAKDQAEDVAKGLLMGAVDYVTKPVHPVVLKARVAIHLNTKIQQTALKKQNYMLRRTVKEKEEADRLMQHDLRNPLQAIMFASESRGIPSDIKELIHDNVEQALSQVDKTLTLARLERGRQALTRVDISLEKFINNFRKSMELLAKKYEVKIHWDVDYLADYSINLDAGLAQNMLSNLIRNAIEASKPGHVVHVSYDPKTFTWNIANPTAVPENMRTRFFEKYATSGKSHGNGLGTYMAKLIAHAHNGHIRLKNTTKGTEVEVVIGKPNK